MNQPVPPVTIGDRVAVTGILNDPAPLTVGMTGTVYWIGNWRNEWTRQIGVRWDDGRQLMLLPGDPFRVIGRAGGEHPADQCAQRAPAAPRRFTTGRPLTPPH